MMQTKIHTRQYDKNRNGFMECHEAVELAKDRMDVLVSQVSSYLRRTHTRLEMDQ